MFWAPRKKFHSPQFYKCGCRSLRDSPDIWRPQGELSDGTLRFNKTRMHLSGLVSDVSCQASHMSSLSCWEDEGMMAVRQPDDAAAKEITIWGGVPAFVSEILLGTFSICVCSNKTAHFFWWDIGSIIKFQHMVCRKVHCRQLFWGMGSKRAGHDTAVGDKEDMVLFHFWVNWTFKTRVYLLF